MTTCSDAKNATKWIHKTGSVFTQVSEGVARFWRVRNSPKASAGRHWRQCIFFACRCRPHTHYPFSVPIELRFSRRLSSLHVVNPKQTPSNSQHVSSFHSYKSRNAESGAVVLVSRRYLAQHCTKPPPFSTSRRRNASCSFVMSKEMLSEKPTATNQGTYLKYQRSATANKA